MSEVPNGVEGSLVVEGKAEEYRQTAKVGGASASMPAGRTGAREVDEAFMLLDDNAGGAAARARVARPLDPLEAKAHARLYPGAPCTNGGVVHPLMVVVQFIFSGYHVLMSSALHTSGVSALVFALYREISASLLMLLLALAAGKQAGHGFHIDRQYWPRLVLMGIFSAGNVLGAVQALTLVSATNFAVMQPSIPVFTMLLSVLFRMERLTALKSLGLAFAVAGAVCVEVMHSSGTSMQKGSKPDFLVGNVIVVLQCLSMASLLVAQKAVLASYPSTVVTTWYYSIGSVLTLLICLAKRLPSAAYGLSTQMEPWAALAYAAVLGTAFNYNAYSWAGTVISPGLVSVYSTIQPVGTALLSFLFLHAKPTAGEILSGVLVIVGLTLTVAGRDIEAKLKRKSSTAGPNVAGALANGMSSAAPRKTS